MKFPIYEHLHYFQKIDIISKKKYQILTIFASYSMYFDALKMNMNSKIWKSNICWSFWLQSGHIPQNPTITAKWPVLWQKWLENITFSIFRVHICFQRIEIRRSRCKNRHILDFFFSTFYLFFETNANVHKSGTSKF